MASPTTSPVIQPTDGATANQISQDRDQELWIIGGGLLIVAGAGAGVWGASRRRKARQRWSEPAFEPRANPPAPAATKIAEPHFEPVAVSSLQTLRSPMARMKTARDWSELEALIAQPPSAANPFVTRKKRLRRAMFMLEHDQIAQDQASRPAKAAADFQAPRPKVSVRYAELEPA